MTAYEGVPGLLVSLDDSVLRLTFDVADKRNALDDDIVAGLIDAIDHAGRNEDVRAIVLTGAGEHFCSGFDIVSRNAGATTRPRVGSIQRRLPSQAHRLIPMMLRTQVPIVVRGAGLGGRHRSEPGGGCRLHRGCHRRPLLGAVRGPGLHPRQRGDVDAPPPHRRGESSRHAPARAGGVRCRGGGVGDGAPGGGRRGVGWRRRRVGPEPGRIAHRRSRLGQVAAAQRAHTTTLEDHLQDEAMAMELSSRSEDFKEGLASFREKRPARYQGR